jgi:hypothetical protein
MAEAADSKKSLSSKEPLLKQTKGAIHIMTRCLPLIFEDKDFYMKVMWDEQPQFWN